MPSNATGIAKQVRYKEEVQWGVAPGASGAQLLRRTSSGLNKKKAAYESGELSSHYQRQDYRHGSITVDGPIAGELSPGTYKDFIAAAVRRAFATVTAISALSITISGAGPTYTAARAAGSWLTDGVKVGQVGKLTAGAFNAANLNKNLLVLAVTALNLTVMPLNGVALVAEGPVASATYTIPGKTTFAPATGHTDKSFSIEHWFADIAQSELFVGCKVNELSIALPASGMATINVGFMGKDMTPATAQYFTTPTGETTTGILAAANGLLLAQGGAIAHVTSLNVSIKGNMTAEPAVGSNVYSDIAEGRILVDGTLTAAFQDATQRDYFLNETEVSLVIALSASPSAAAEFITITLPRIKFGGADKDDGDKMIIQTLPFVGLFNSGGGAGVQHEQSTIAFQDSQA